MPGTKADIATRVQVLTLRHHTSLKNADIERITGFSPRQIQRVVADAYARGYKPGSKILDKHVESRKPTGRPPKITEETTAAVLEYVRATQGLRTENLDQIAEKSNSGLKRGSVIKILRKAGLYRVKRSNQSGMIFPMTVSTAARTQAQPVETTPFFPPPDTDTGHLIYGLPEKEQQLQGTALRFG